jgi:HAE1 family hydrophobic/amphiphilic exporter-1
MISLSARPTRGRIAAITAARILSAFAKWTTTPIQPLSISHQGQFPAITIGFNLAQGTALGQATDAIERAKAQLNLPTTINTTFQGNAQAFQDSLATVPMLILAALIVVYLILGVLLRAISTPSPSSRRCRRRA